MIADLRLTRPADLALRAAFGSLSRSARLMICNIWSCGSRSCGTEGDRSGVGRFLVLPAVFVFAIGGTAGGQVTASLSPAVENSGSGQTLVFCGTLTNTSSTAQVFLNDVHFALKGASVNDLGTTDIPFFENVPGILNPGESYTGELFTVTVSGAAPAADYGGSATILGGTDEYAANDLGVAAFKVLSPAVTVAASGTAAELGPVSGTFTITRTGSTDIPLTVGFAMGGTAVSGSTYQGFVDSCVIAAGSSTGTVTITPISDDIAEGTRAAVLTLTGSTTYDLGGAVGDTVYILDKPVDAWRYANFGAAANSALAADGASWSGAGIANLTAYALGMNPLAPSPKLLPAGGVSAGYLTLSYVPNAAASDVSYAVEASTDLIGWSGTNVQVVNVANPSPPGSVTYRYGTPLGTAARVFLRLRVVRTDE